MKRIISAILAVLSILPALCFSSFAGDVWTYKMVISGIEVTVTADEPLGDAAYRAAYDTVHYYYLQIDPSDTFAYLQIDPPDTFAGSYTVEETYSHSFVATTVVFVSHKYYRSAPRCVENIYWVNVCRDCGYTEKKMVDQKRIYCCGDERSPFDDVGESAWYYDAVCGCMYRGYMGETPPRRFSPNATLTRAMFAAILAKIDGADLSAFSVKSPFRDVRGDQWYTKPINWAYINGYTAGKSEKLYGINDPVTREQLAVFLYTYARKKGFGMSQLANISGFRDKNSVSDWATVGMRWAVGAGLISGTSSKELLPKKAATRAETAVIVQQFVNKVR